MAQRPNCPLMVRPKSVALNTPHTVHSCFFSDCNRTYSAASKSKKEIIQESLPKLFQNHIICAGTDLGSQGSCRGDSGGPLMYLKRETHQCKNSFFESLITVFMHHKLMDAQTTTRLPLGHLYNYIDWLLTRIFTGLTVKACALKDKLSLFGCRDSDCHSWRRR